MAACNTCNKEEPAVQLKRCAKCSTTQYCSRDCQKADWKAHKKICGKQADSVANANLPDPDEMSRSPKKGLEKSVPNPFTRLDNGTYLHNRPEKDVYRLLIDTYRLRMDDMYNLEGQADGDSLYGGASNGLRGFQRFLRQASIRRGLLPSWWSPEKQQECEQLGMDSSQWQNLTKKTSKQEIIDYYGDPRFPMQLRMVGEAVYLSAPGGGDGSQMRKMMAAMEGGGMEGMGMSMMDASSMRR
ncbi:MYND domain protein [Fusarium subglutinans]|uniref:MYND domain protein n=1 Tax=Gibberella subglutinans TaxID=42677 RepID=A0A8H5PSE9_GIBSU|nr:MYND domain protein [Fusarium subglutinans]KAF5602575.1 MYND domain protein [Fusarium subglutinans]